MIKRAHILIFSCTSLTSSFVEARCLILRINIEALTVNLSCRKFFHSDSLTQDIMWVFHLSIYTMLFIINKIYELIENNVMLMTSYSFSYRNNYCGRQHRYKNPQEAFLISPTFNQTGRLLGWTTVSIYSAGRKRIQGQEFFSLGLIMHQTTIILLITLD